MELADRVELRRFVGRELLLWLWFETEVLEATLETAQHGAFGMWVEGRLVLSEGREVTTIRGSLPGHHREAKESLLRGKLPELAGLHLSWAGQDATFVLKAETLAIASLALPTVLDKGQDEAPKTVAEVLGPKKPPPKRRKQSAEAEALDASEEEHQTFYERMRLAREVEEIVEALYADFLTLRLGSGWDEVVMPALSAWSRGKPVDEDNYKRARDRALAGRPKRK